MLPRPGWTFAIEGREGKFIFRVTDANGQDAEVEVAEPLSAAEYSELWNELLQKLWRPLPCPTL